MSITDLEKTFENNMLVYCNLNNKIIIECICLTKLYQLNKYNNKNFMCNKVKVITIYDIYKNIITIPIQINIFKISQIKIYDILENLNKHDIYFSKTFIESFLINNKLNNIKYDITYNNKLTYNFSYDNICVKLYNNFNKKFIIHNDKGSMIYYFYFHNNVYYIYCYENENYITYFINNDYIKINSTTYNRFILFHKEDLKIFEIQEYYKTKLYNEIRNYNKEITNFKKINNGKIEKFISNNINPPFSKPLKRYCIELINHYNNNINNFIKIIKPIFKKFNKVYYNFLLNYNLEMIDFK